MVISAVVLKSFLQVSDLEEELQFKDNQYSNLLRDITEDKHTSRSTGITVSEA